MLETDFFSSLLLPIVLGLIMLGMGLSLTRNDFKYIFLFPKGILTGLFSQMVFLPALGFLIAWISGLPEYLMVGLILVAACPGGATSGLIVHLTGGNVAMSVSFTAINSFLTMLSIPFIVNLALYFFMGTQAPIEISFADTMVHVLLITVIPCIIGIAIRDKYPITAHNLERPLKIIMPIMLAVAMIGSIFLEKKKYVIPADSYAIILPFALMLNIGGLFGGYLIARLMKLGIRNRLTVGVEVGLQNTAMAISIATAPTLLNDTHYAVPAAVYALFSFFTAILFALWVRRKTLRALLKRKGFIR